MDAVLDPPVIRKQRKQVSRKQLLYAELRAKGLTQKEASEKVGYSSRTGALKAERNPQVREYLAEVQKQSAIRASYVVGTAMDEALDGMEFAKATKNATAYVKAVELRAKLSGLLIDKVEVFTADLRGALLEASKRVIQVGSSSYAVEQIPQAEPQATENTTV